METKNAIFTLICELAKFEDLPPKDLVMRALEDIENKIKGPEESEEEYYSFYMALYQGTASKKARMTEAVCLNNIYQGKNHNVEK